MLAPTLTTERLILRAPSLDDWEAYAAVWADERMTRFIGGEPRSRKLSWAKFCQAAGLWPLLGFGYWAFTDRVSGAFIGNGGLARFERGIAELEGYPEAGWAFAPSAWGCGLATEAVDAIMNWADEALRAEVRCIIALDNLASIRVAEKCGFSYLCDNESELGLSRVMRRGLVKEQSAS
jgi:RimJ/RimL family protein N-acetyltransferase